MNARKPPRTTCAPFVALAAFCIVFASPCAADTSDHQRVGVERKDPLIISPGFAVTLYDNGEPDAATLSGANLRSAAETALTVSETFSVDITWRNVWNLFASIPCMQTPSLNVEKAGAAYAAWGDPDIGAGRSFRFRDWKIDASMRWTFPLGIWNAYETEAKTDRNCHFGIFAVLGQNSVFSPNYDFLQPEQLIQSQFFGNADWAKYNPSQFVP